MDSDDTQSISLTLDDVLDMTDANHMLQVTGGDVDQVQILPVDDTDNKVKIFTDDGTAICA